MRRPIRRSCRSIRARASCCKCRSSRICKALGGTPPEGFNYELFLDDKGEKISKSKGNGLTIEDWLTYASPESLTDSIKSLPAIS